MPEVQVALLILMTKLPSFVLQISSAEFIGYISPVGVFGSEA